MAANHDDIVTLHAPPTHADEDDRRRERLRDRLLAYVRAGSPLSPGI